MTEYQVETPEQVALEYDVAGIGSRFLATMIDTIVQIILLVVLFIASVVGIAFVLSLFGASDGDGEWADNTTVAVFLIINFLIMFGYHIFFELIWHGQTPGKRAIGLRVIKEGGRPLGFVDSAIRNVVRLVDFLPFSYGIGSIVMFIDGQSRRLGDLAGGTLVVKERRELSLTEIAAPAEATPLAPELRRLKASDVSLLREYLRRRDSMALDASKSLAIKLATSLAARTGRVWQGESADAYLQQMAEDLGWRVARRDTLEATPIRRGIATLPSKLPTRLAIAALAVVAIVVVVMLVSLPDEQPGTPTPTGSPVVTPTATAVATD